MFVNHTGVNLSAAFNALGTSRSWAGVLHYRLPIPNIHEMTGYGRRRRHQGAADRCSGIDDDRKGDGRMKKIFWLLTMGALASAAMAATLGRAEDTPASEVQKAN